MTERQTDYLTLDSLLSESIACESTIAMDLLGSIIDAPDVSSPIEFAKSLKLLATEAIPISVWWNSIASLGKANFIEFVDGRYVATIRGKEVAEDRNDRINHRLPF